MAAVPHSFVNTPFSDNKYDDNKETEDQDKLDHYLNANVVCQVDNPVAW